MIAILEKLEKILDNVGNPILRELDSVSKGFDRERFIEQLDALGLEPREDLLNLYSWKTGIKTELALDVNFDFNYKVFSMGSFIEYKGAIDLYILDEHTEKIFTKKYLPIVFDCILEDPILINLSKKSKDFGAIFYYSPSLTLSMLPVKIYDSLEIMINTIIQCYLVGAYQITGEGLLEVNDDLEKEISQKLNKTSKFWLYQV